MDLRDRSSGCVRLCCWKIQFCTPAHERKLGLASPARLCLHMCFVVRRGDAHMNRNSFNLQMNEQSGRRKGDVQVTHLV